jgi:hypothetical protein
MATNTTNKDQHNKTKTTALLRWSKGHTTVSLNADKSAGNSGFLALLLVLCVSLMLPGVAPLTLLALLELLVLVVTGCVVSLRPLASSVPILLAVWVAVVVIAVWVAVVEVATLVLSLVVLVVGVMVASLSEWDALLAGG